MTLRVRLLRFARNDREHLAPRHDMDHTGQSTVEYVVLGAVVVAALISMQVYMKHGMAGHFRSSADSIGEQYAPAKTTSNFTIRNTGTTITKSELKRDQEIGPNMRADVVENTTTIDKKNPETTTRTGYEEVGALGTDLWND